jgi:hypothetical protein
MQRKKEKGIVHPRLASTWPSCLGRLSLGWQPMVKTEEAEELWARALDSGGRDVADVPAVRTGREGG